MVLAFTGMQGSLLCSGKVTVAFEGQTVNWSSTGYFGLLLDILPYYSLTPTSAE